MRGRSPAGERARLGDVRVHQHALGGDRLPRGGGTDRLQPVSMVWANDGGAAVGGENQAGPAAGGATGADRLGGDPGGTVLRRAGRAGGGGRAVGSRGGGERAAAGDDPTPEGRSAAGEVSGGKGRLVPELAYQEGQREGDASARWRKTARGNR